MFYSYAQKGLNHWTELNFKDCFKSVKWTNLAIIGSERISSPTPSTSTTKAISYFLTVVDTKSTWNAKNEDRKQS